MESSENLIWLILYPLLGAVILGLGSYFQIKALKSIAGWIASIMILLAFSKIYPVAQLFFEDPKREAVVLDLGQWMKVGNLSLSFRLYFDALSAILCSVITFVASLIHVYSIGYMAHDEGRSRYFAYLNLFCVFMLILVSASSLPLMFVGWEGVGLCSYLLIGFWFKDKEKAAAGKKAFLVNRIGDAGFFLGMILMAVLFGTFEFSEIKNSTILDSLHPKWALELAALLLFVACMGKSAQFPLYVWLPDAMAGPTPVSALIHAATMVTAGVYLIARLSFVYAITPFASEIIAWSGGITALFAATIAMTQKDIKKVLAFSTVSQLGFMVLAMGMGVYWAGVFHLITHAFFKALLFLAAGSVIHALHEEQDIFKMGGLKSYLVATTIVFFVGFYAIIGGPFGAGWYSKDAILFGALQTHHSFLFWMALLAALFTASYMTRLFALVFLDVPRINKDKIREMHESPPIMLVPMFILAFFSIFGGMKITGFSTALQEYFSPSQAIENHSTFVSEGQLAFGVTFLVLVVVWLTIRHTIRFLKAEDPTPLFPKLQKLVERQYRVDEFLVFLGGPINRLIASITALIDEYVVDGFIRYFVKFTHEASLAVSRMQTGVIQFYALTMLVGVFILAWFFVGGVS